MKEKIKHYMKEIVTFFIVMTIFANLISIYKSSDLNNQALAMPQFTLIDNQKYIVEEKPLLLHFWATWCPTCKLEASNIEMLSKSYNVVTIAVKSGSDEEIKKFLLENDLHFKVVNDEAGNLASKFNIAAFPTTFIYDKDKNLVFSEVGYTSTLGLYLRMLWAEYK